MKTKIALALLASGAFLASCTPKNCYKCQLPDNTFLEKMCTDTYSQSELVDAQGACKALGGKWYYNDNEVKN